MFLWVLISSSRETVFRKIRLRQIRPHYNQILYKYTSWLALSGANLSEDTCSKHRSHSERAQGLAKKHDGRLCGFRLLFLLEGEHWLCQTGKLYLTIIKPFLFRMVKLKWSDWRQIRRLCWWGAGERGDQRSVRRIWDGSGSCGTHFVSRKLKIIRGLILKILKK